MKQHETENLAGLSGMERKVMEYIRKQNLLISGDNVLAGISGGADSVCLLFMLLKCRELFGGKLKIHVVHLHHMIRDREADEDMAYVKRLCEEHQLPFHGVRMPVEQIAAEEGLSVEEAGRVVRYREFERISLQEGCNKIAVAHHRDDNAETILMNLFRGSGLKGVSGIRPVRNRIIRPLLDVSRKEIEWYLSQRKIAFRTDSTNLACDYTRNRIRNELIPYIKEHINEKAAEHIVRFGSYAEQIDCYFQKKANILLKKYATIEKNRVILCLDCLLEDEIEVSYVLRTCIEMLGCGLKDVGTVHIEQIKKLFHGKTGRRIRIPGGICVEKSYRQGIFQIVEEDDGNTIDSVGVQTIELLEENKPVAYSFFKGEYVFSVKNAENNQTFPKKKYTKWFDYDKIKFMLQLRTRKTGDYIVINANGGHKKLKDYFIDAKIPRQNRDEMVLLADGSEIVWVVGMRISETYKVDENTKRILEVVCKKDVCMEEGLRKE